MAVSILLDNHLLSSLYQVARILLLLYVAAAAYRGIGKLIRNYKTAKKFVDLPCVPRHWLWGNLVNVGEKLSPTIKQHPDYAFEEVWQELGRPPAYLVDLSPVDTGILVIADPYIAEVISQPSTEFKYSTPKSDTLQALTTLVGNHSLVLIEGEEWRTQRKRFNKGFAPAHLNTLIPLVVSKTRIFLDRLKEYAQSGETLALKDLASDLTTDVITQVAIDKDFQAQTIPEGQGPKSTFGILTSIKVMSSLVEKVGQGFELASYLYPQRRLKEWLYDKLYTRAIYNEIVNRLPSIDTESSDGSAKYPTAASSAKAIVHLALTGVQPTPAVINSTISQVKTFLFAGQDTTSTLIQWMVYELSKSYPSSPHHSDEARKIRERLCAEHDTVWGTEDPCHVLDSLLEEGANVDELLGVKLPYTTAFIKETLRLHPPGGSARLIPLAPDRPIGKPEEPGPYFIELPAWTNSNTGEMHDARKVRIDGMRLYNCHFIIHRNPNTWGNDVYKFNPDRFLDTHMGTTTIDEVDKAMHVQEASKGSIGSSAEKLPHPNHISTLPTGSYRPFERGPRTCIGTNLAYMEAKIVLSIVARGFEWTKVGLDGTPSKSGDRDVWQPENEADKKVAEAQKWEVWSVNNVTSVPVDGMRMRAKLRV